jgi:hypothetical protein
MASVGCKLSYFCLYLRTLMWGSIVGAMFYISPTLTTLMLALVPPVSFGAVRTVQDLMECFHQLLPTGILRPLPQEAVQ